MSRLYTLLLTTVLAVLTAHPVHCAAQEQSTGDSVPAVRTDMPPVGRTTGTVPARSDSIFTLRGGAMLRVILGPAAFETGLNRLGLITLPPDGSANGHILPGGDLLVIGRQGQATVEAAGTTVALTDSTVVRVPGGASIALVNNGATTTAALVIEAAGSAGDRTAQSSDQAVLTLSQLAMERSSEAHDGLGGLLYRRLFSHETFGSTMWAVSHVFLDPCATIGYHLHATREEVYFVLDGVATGIGNGHIYPLGRGDGAVCSPGSAHGIANVSRYPMELLIFSASRRKGVVTGERNLGDDLARLLR